MKSIYFVAPNIASTQQISDDLHAVGIRDFYVHVISRDEAGLKTQHIHSSNYLETLDVVRDGAIGAVGGFLVGLAGVGLLIYFDPFGPKYEVPVFVYAALTGVATLFGAWQGGLIGVENENKKLAEFHDDIVAGKFLVLVYVRKNQEAAVRKMMQERHPEAELAAVDTHFVNPFSVVHRQSGAVAPKG